MVKLSLINRHIILAADQRMTSCWTTKTERGSEVAVGDVKGTGHSAVRVAEGDGAVQRGLARFLFLKV